MRTLCVFPVVSAINVVLGGLQCLTLSESNRTVSLRECDGQDDQEWTLSNDAIQSKTEPPLCLEVEAEEPGASSHVGTGRCNNRPSQSWIHTPGGGLATRMDESWCLDGEPTNHTADLRLRGCTKDFHDEANLGPSLGLLQKYADEYLDEDLEAIEDLGETLDSMQQDLETKAENEGSSYKLKLDQLVNQVDDSARGVKKEHEDSRSSFATILPTVESTIKKANPILATAQKRFLAQDDSLPELYEEFRNVFMAQVQKDEVKWEKSYDKMVKKAEKSLEKYEKKDQKSWAKGYKKAEKWYDKLFKAIAKREKKIYKIQGKMSHQIYDNLDQTVDVLGDTEMQQSDVERMMENFESKLEYLLEDGVPEAPSEEQVAEMLEQAQEKQEEYIETGLDAKATTWEDLLGRVDEKMRGIIQRYMLQTLKQEDRPRRNVQKFAAKMQANLDRVLRKVTRNSAVSAAEMDRQERNVVLYEKALRDLGTTVTRMKSESIGSAFAQYKQSLADGIYGIVDWLEKRVPKDHAAMESYIDKSGELLNANLDQAFSEVEGAGMSQLMNSWVRFLAQKLVMTTTVNKNAQSLNDMKGPVEADREDIKASLLAAQSLTDKLVSINHIPTAMTKAATEFKRRSTDLGVNSGQRLDSASQNFAGKLIKMTSDKKMEVSRVLEQAGKDIANQAGGTVSQIESNTVEGEETADQVKYEMAQVGQKLDGFEAKLLKQSGLLTRNLPSKLKNFEDGFKADMAESSYSLDDVLAKLASYDKEVFAAGTQNMTDGINWGKGAIKDFMEAVKMQVLSEEKKVGEEMSGDETRVHATMEDLDSVRKDITKEAVGPVTGASELAGKQAQNMDKFAINLGAALTSIGKMMKQLDVGRENVRVKSEKAGQEVAVWHEDEAHTTTTKIARAASDAIRMVNVYLQKIVGNTNEQMSQNTKLVDEKKAKLGKLVDGLTGTIDAVLHPWQEGAHNTAMANWYDALQKMSANLHHSGEAAKLIAKSQQEVLGNYHTLVQTQKTQFSFNNEQLGKKSEGGLAKQKEAMKDALRRMLARKDEMEQTGSLRIGAMRSRMESVQGQTSVQKRRIEAAAASIMTVLSSHAEGEKKTIANMIAAQDEAKTRLKLADQANAENIRGADRKLERADAASERFMSTMEGNLFGQLEALDMTGLKKEIEMKLKFLQEDEKHRGEDSEHEVDTDISSVNDITSETLDKVEKTMKTFAAQNSELSAVASERNRELGGVRDDFQDDESKVRGLLAGVHEVASDIVAHIQDQQDRVEAKHKKNEDSLAAMQGMSEYTDADALDRVVLAVNEQTAMDDEVWQDVTNRVLPQQHYWHDGLEAIFAKLGMDLDLDAVQDKAKAKMAEEMMQREELNLAGNELEAFLRAEVMATRLGHRHVDKHMQRIIDDIAARNDLSTAEKLRLIQSAREDYSRQHMTVNTRVQQLMASQAEAGVKMSEMISKINNMVKRARDVAKPPWKAKSMYDMAKQKDAMKDFTAQIKTDIISNTQDTAAARSQNKAATGISLSQWNPSALIEEDESSTAAENTAAAAALTSVEEKLRVASDQRDKQDEEWESVLDDAENMNLRRSSAEVRPLSPPTASA
jgi:hypothetical protein